MARPDFVTITGFDDATDVGRMLELSHRYPIEWGVLMSPTRQGVDPRFPSLRRVAELTGAAANRRLRLSAHLCGGHARAILADARLPALDDVLGDHFRRVQVNTADPAADPLVVRLFAERLGVGTRGILQCRDRFPASTDVDWLFDASGGLGLTPSDWPEPGDARGFVGYAGGLGPGTAAAALSRIAPRHAEGRPYWIDCETRVRTDDRLDLDKVEAMCAVAFGGRDGVLDG